MPNGMPSNGGSGGGGYSPPPKGTTADQRNTIVQGNILIETIEAGVGAPYQPPHHMGYFVNNACLDPSLQNPPEDDDDDLGSVQDEVGFDFG